VRIFTLLRISTRYGQLVRGVCLTWLCIVCQSALGFELWSVSDDILFDNIIVTDDKRVAEDWAEQTWVIKHEQELAGAASAVSCFLSSDFTRLIIASKGGS